MAKNIMNLIKSPFTLIGWFIVMFGLLFYTGKIEGYNIFYSIMGLLGPTTLFMLIVLHDETDLWEIMKFPMRGNFWVSSAHFSIGFAIFFGISLFTGVLQKLLSPKMLFSASLWQTFTVSSTPFAQVFNVGFIAPILEELMWLMVALIALTAWVTLINRSGKFKTIGAYIWTFSIVGVSFMLFHTLNPTYITTGAFLMAFGWRVIITTLVFTFSMYEFGVGCHMGNNLAALGIVVVARGLLLSWAGIILLAFIVSQFMIAIYGITHNKYKGEDLWTVSS